MGPDCSKEGEGEREVRHLDLPALCGQVEEHFYEIASQQVDPYLRLAEDLARSKRDVPPMPPEWRAEAGWTRYSRDGSSSSSVTAPGGRWVVLDVEVCVREGPQPTLAAALSQDGRWYSWVSPRLAGRERSGGGNNSRVVVHREDLISMGGLGGEDRHRLVVGHNISYDRAR